MTHLIVDIVSALEDIQSVAPGAANRNPRTGLKNAIAFLKGRSEVTVEELKLTLLAEKPQRKPKRKLEPANQGVVDNYVRLLKQTDFDPVRYENVIQNGKADPSVREQEWQSIRKEFAGYKKKVSGVDTNIKSIVRYLETEWKKRNR